MIKYEKAYYIWSATIALGKLSKGAFYHFNRCVKTKSSVGGGIGGLWR